MPPSTPALDRHRRSPTSLLLALAAVTGPAAAQTVHLAVDATANVKPISRYIYGVNGSPGEAADNLALLRLGGNRWTAYNWVNNASNAGSDYLFQNDGYLGGGDDPGGALMPAIETAASRGIGLLLTVPINGYVAADKNADGDVRNSGANYLATRFREGRARKNGPFTLTPSPATPTVYQDEMAHWLTTRYPASQTDPRRPIWFSLDNEPDLWAYTHAEVHPTPATYAELVSKTVDYARALKAVAPASLVFGPVSYGWYGFVRLQGAADAGNRDFLTYFLRRMQLAERNLGRRLLDVLDLHWYPEARGGGVRVTDGDTSPAVVAARLQAPRSLWDPTYVETSWIAQDWLGGAVKLLPRLRAKIASAYPGTKLAITEYNFGAGQHISGGLAQADVLGIFGRDGVFAAAQWPLQSDEAFVAGAFAMFRNVDGQGASFGDTSVRATTDAVADTSVYASLDSTQPDRLVIVAINKTDHPLAATITLRHAPVLRTAHLYQLTAASPRPQAHGTLPIVGGRSLDYTLPAFSVSTLVLND